MRVWHGGTPPMVRTVAHTDGDRSGDFDFIARLVFSEFSNFMRRGAGQMRWIEMVSSHPCDILSPARTYQQNTHDAPQPRDFFLAVKEITSSWSTNWRCCRVDGGCPTLYQAASALAVADLAHQVRIVWHPLPAHADNAFSARWWEA